MKPKTVMLLAVAVCSGLLAMVGVQQAMSSNESRPEETVKVLVALEDIDVGIQLTEQNVGFREKPRSAVPDDAVTSVEQYEKRSPSYALRADDIVRAGKLSKPNVFGKSTQIKEGMRVVTIPVDDTQTVSGLLSPGDRVDVLVTYQHRDGRGRQVTKTMTLLEYVEVFATDDKTARESSEPGSDGKNKTRTVALLLPPEHVPYIKLAESKGKLALSWRRRDDDTLASIGSINEELLNELEGLHPMGDRAGAPLFAGEADYVSPPPDFNGIGSQTQPPQQDLDSMLTTAAGNSAPVAMAAEPTPPKPTWKLEIFVGNDAQAHEFELPEEVVEPAPEDAPRDDSEGGSKFWSLLKQAL